MSIENSQRPTLDLSALCEQLETRAIEYAGHPGNIQLPWVNRAVHFCAETKCTGIEANPQQTGELIGLAMKAGLLTIETPEN